MRPIPFLLVILSSVTTCDCSSAKKSVNSATGKPHQSMSQLLAWISIGAILIIVAIIIVATIRSFLSYTKSSPLRTLRSSSIIPCDAVD